jgi:hypothetical protein
MSREFELNTWGTVVEELARNFDVIALRVEEVGSGGGFLVIQRRKTGEIFDERFETEEDVVDYLSSYRVDWSKSP